jgi:hypothetical protein
MVLSSTTNQIIAEKFRDEILVVPNPGAYSIDYIWELNNIAVTLTNIREERQGLVADFSAECPVGNDIKSEVIVTLNREASRKSIIRTLHEIPGIEFKEWDRLVEYAFTETVTRWKENKVAKDTRMPILRSISDILAKDNTSTTSTDRIIGLIQAKGLGTLGAMPKKGKTVMAMEMCKAIATGQPFLGMKTQSGRCLYIALEDSESRLRERIKKMGITPDMSIHFIYRDSDNAEPLPPLQNEGLDFLKKAILAVKADFVVIDTTRRAMPGIDENKPEFADLTAKIQELAIQLEVFILLIHHFTKRPGGDVLVDLRGHGGFGAVLDMGIGLYPDSTPGHYTMKTVSRDAEELELDLYFDKPKLLWTVDQNYHEVQKIETDAAMLNLLSTMSRPTIEEISDANGKSRQANLAVLQRLMDAGAIGREQDQRGYQKPFIYYAL